MELNLSCTNPYCTKSPALTDMTNRPDFLIMAYGPYILSDVISYRASLNNITARCWDMINS